jgi:hypothetical protein
MINKPNTPRRPRRVRIAFAVLAVTGGIWAAAALETSHASAISGTKWGDIELGL